MWLALPDTALGGRHHEVSIGIAKRHDALIDVNARRIEERLCFRGKTEHFQVAECIMDPCDRSGFTEQCRRPIGRRNNRHDIEQYRRSTGELVVRDQQRSIVELDAADGRADDLDRNTKRRKIFDKTADHRRAGAVGGENTQFATLELRLCTGKN